MKPSLAVPCLLLVCMGAGCSVEERIPAEMSSLAENRPLGREKGLNATIQMDTGTVEVSGELDRNYLYSVDLDYDKASYRPDFNYDPKPGGEAGTLSLRVESTHKTGLRPDRRNNRLRSNFSPSVPLNLKVNAGIGDSRLNMSGLQITRLDLESGVGSAHLSAYEPNKVQCDSIKIKSGVGEMNAIGLGNINFRDLEFEGGIGQADLDFTGIWQRDANLQIRVGVGTVLLKMPRDIGIRVEAEKSFLSGLHLDRFSKHDTYYYSDNYDKCKIRITIRVTTGVGEFRITWI